VVLGDVGETRETDIISWGCSYSWGRGLVPALIWFTDFVVPALIWFLSLVRIESQGAKQRKLRGRAALHVIDF